jgi:hypothetical protein
MINPSKLTPMRKKWFSHQFVGEKFYLAVLSGAGYAKACHRIFKRATEAEAYAVRVQARWVRLYEAMIVSMAAENAPKSAPTGPAV